MWQDLVDQQDKWIGGRLIDHGDFEDRAESKREGLPDETIITGFKLTDHYFEVEGEDFNCGVARHILGISQEHINNGLVRIDSGGHVFSIVKPTVEEAGAVRSLIIDTDVTVINNPSEPLVEPCSDREKANK